MEEEEKKKSMQERQIKKENDYIVVLLALSVLHCCRYPETHATVSGFAVDSRFDVTHREDKTRMDGGCGHLLLLAQVQQEFVLQVRVQFSERDLPYTDRELYNISMKTA